LRLSVRPGRERAFEAQFQRLRVLARAAEVAGMRSGELLRPRQGADYVVVGTWDHAQDYQRWVESPVRAEIGKHLEEFTLTGVGDLFEVVETYHPSS
jgi:heme-degrading monooxygenase HmoA